MRQNDTPRCHFFVLNHISEDSITRRILWLQEEHRQQA